MRRLRALNVQQILSIGLAVLLLQPDPALFAQDQKPVRHVVPAPNPVATRVPKPPRIPVRRGLIPPVAAQTVMAAPGQSQTLLPDGRTLLLGGVSVAGPLAAASVGGSTTALSASLLHPRAWHTATLLPDGTVFVHGGLGSSGLVSESEIFDPSTPQSSPVMSVPQARAYHTATVLTDGRVLIAGGIGPDGVTLARLDLWDPRTGQTTVPNAQLAIPRRGHTAQLQADGSVLIRGGITQNGSVPAFDESFQPGTLSVQPQAAAADESELRVTASIPSDQEQGVALDTWIAVRFSRQMKVTTLNGSTVTLAGGQPVSASVVPVEDGRLLFVKPTQPLAPGTAYVLSILGAQDNAGNPLALTDIQFQTAGPANVTGTADSAAPASASHPIPPPSTKNDDPPPPALQGPSGVTSLYGAIRTVAGKYLPGVSVNLDCNGKVSNTKSDSQGRFLLVNVPTGHCSLETDGSTAQDPGNKYGTFFHGVDLVAGRTNILPYTVWMPPLDQQHQASVAGGSITGQVITNPNVKGLELHLPPNSVIRDNNGNVVTSLSISPVPAGRTPFPMPKGVAFATYFTIQPAGSYVEVGGSRYTPGKGAQIIYPNRYRAPAGTVFNFWEYDPEGRGWYVYGTGKVSADTKSIVPDPGTVVSRFTGAMVAPPLAFVAALPSTPPGCWLGPLFGLWGLCVPAPSPKKGDPVSPGSGLFEYSSVDLSVTDVTPIRLDRFYRQGDPISRAFGIGSSHPYDIFLVGDGTLYSAYTYMDLVLPDGTRVHYPRTSPGTSWTDAVYEDTSTASSFFGSVISWNGAGWNLRFKNGTLYSFPDTSNQNVLAKMGVIAMHDRNGNAITLTRDPATGNLQRIASPNGHWIALTYDSSNRITAAQDNGGRTVSYLYDEGGRLVQFTNTIGGVTQYAYDANNQMVSITDPRGITYVTNQYDTEGHVIQQTAADGGIYRFAYTEDTNGNIIQTDVTDPRNTVTRYTFDTNFYYSAGRLTSTTFALGHSEQEVIGYLYQGSTSLLASVTDALGRMTSFSYDNVGNITSITWPVGSADVTTTKATYDPVFSRVLTATDPLNHTTQFSYDSSGNPTTVTDPLNHARSMAYNTSGQVTAITTGPAGTVQLQYTAGLLTGITDAGGDLSTFQYDNLGRRVATTDPLGNLTRRDFDAANRVIQTTDALQAMTRFTFDPNGNVLSVTDARNGTTTYSYDDMDRKSTRTDPVSAVESFAYDPNGNLMQHTDRKQQVTNMTHDALNRLSSVTYADGSSTAFTYDAGNRLVQITDSLSGAVTRTYDDLSRLTSVTGPQGTISYTYDAAGRRISMTVAGQLPVRYSYDDANRLTQVSQGTSVVTIVYDDANRATSVTLPDGLVESYGYDQASRLESIGYAQGSTSLGNLIYTYDAAGRRTSVGGSLARTNLPTAVSNAIYDAANRLTSWGSTSISYDADGNLINDGVNSYTWNVRNQLVAMTGASFQYDPLGRRTGKTISGANTNFLYDGVNIVQELSGASPKANLLTGLGVDEIFQRSDASGVMSLLTDGLGSTVALSDAAGRVQTQYTYDPFGQTTQNGTTTGNATQFTGRENDGTGLYYSRTRYYNPAMGRFVSEDPAGFVDGTNLYAYAGSSPTNFVDAFGLDKSGPSGRPLPGDVGGAGGGGGPNNAPNGPANPPGPPAPPGNDPCGNATLAAAGVTAQQQIATAQGFIAAGQILGSITAGQSGMGGLLNFLGGMGGYYEAVHTGGPNDIKNQPGPGYQNQTGVDAGNISFGITCPYGAAFCQFAAGAAQTLSGHPNSDGTLATGFDTPSDNAGIRTGQAMRAAGCHE